MLKKVCLLVDRSKFEIVTHFTSKLAEAMERKGIEVQIIDANQEYIDPEVFRDFSLNPPDITCSFNRIDKLSSGKYLWDFLQIPHISFLLDPPIYSMDQTDSDYLILTSVDRSDAEAVRASFPRILFWPHAVEKELHSEDNLKRDIDVVFFGSFANYVNLRKEWKKKLTGQLSWVIDFAIDIAVINTSITLSDALSTSWETAGLNIKSGKENFLLLYHYLVQFMREKDHFELINGIRDAKVHIYGEIENGLSPEQLFPNNHNIVFHPPAGYSESIEILKRSKICLNSDQAVRDGTHHRVFSSLACGALPITSDSKYLSEAFMPNEDILLYKANHWNEVNEWVNEYLGNEEKRRMAAASGREKVMKGHTWDARVDQLLNDLPQILDQMRHKA